MSDEPNIFEQFMFEAPDDDPGADVTSDESPASDDAGAVPPDDNGDTDAAPDIDDTTPDDGMGDIDDTGGDDDAPPDIDDDTDSGDDYTGDEEAPQKNMHLNDKVSAILNVNLYQTFLNLLDSINSHVTVLDDNRDMFTSLSKDAMEIVPALKKLDDNIRLYLDNTFVNERYEKNLLFFNKCLNLFNLLDDKFSDQISKGIKEHK